MEIGNPKTNNMNTDVNQCAFEDGHQHNFFFKVNFGAWLNPLQIKNTKAIADICVIFVWTLFSLPFGLVCLKLSACRWMRSNGIYLFVIQRLIELKTEKHKTFFYTMSFIKAWSFQMVTISMLSGATFLHSYSLSYQQAYMSITTAIMIHIKVLCLSYMGFFIYTIYML